MKSSIFNWPEASQSADNSPSTKFDLPPQPGRVPYSGMRTKEGSSTGRPGHSAEQIANNLREAEVKLSKGNSVPEAAVCPECGEWCGRAPARP
jgi:hypothetical protein